MVISTHHHVISNDALTHQRCLMLLKELGAHVIAEHTVAESFSGDGLIAVSFDPQDRDLEVIISRCRVGESWFGDPLWDLDAARSSDGNAGTERAELEALRAQLADIERTRTWKLRNALNRALRRA
jgi:negative regulator of genetic competence, sporulation and motility